MPSAAAVAAIVDTHRRFDGRVVYRQVPTALAGQPRPAWWRPTRRPWRWNDAFPTLYTALSLEVAYAERLKRTGAAPVRLVVGVADVSIGRTLDLTDPSVLVRLRVRVADLVADDHTVTRALGTAFYQAGITGLLVPAAIATTAREYPRLRVVRDGRATVHTTPTEGTNLVIFRSNRRQGDSWRERVAERFVCEIAGLEAGSTPSQSP